MTSKDILDDLEWRLIDLEYARLKKANASKQPVSAKRSSGCACASPCREVPLTNITGPSGKRLMKAQAGNRKYAVGTPHWQCAGCGRK
jgi:hypothetical protein